MKPIDRHKPLDLPPIREGFINRACAEPDGCISAGDRLRAAEQPPTPPRESLRLDGEIPCWTCGKPATCIGSYEGRDGITTACDECCAHGCEDGRCWRIVKDASPPTPPSGRGEDAGKVIAGLLKIIDAQDKLLIAYRTGSRRAPEKALDVLAKKEEILAAARPFTKETR